MADDIDILTLEEAAAALRITSGQVTSDIELMVSGISQAVDELCGPVVAREVTVTLSGPYSGPLLLTTTPVLEVTDVVEYTGTSGTTLGEDDWQLDADGHFARLFRRSGGYDTSWVAGARNVTVTLTAGRYATTEDVAYRWKDGVSSILRTKWQWESPSWARNRDALATDDQGLPQPFSLEAAIRSTFPSDLPPPGIA